MNLDNILMFSLDENKRLVLVETQDFLLMEPDEKSRLIVDMIESLKTKFHENESML